MADYLEVWERSEPNLVVLEADRLSIGKTPANDVTLSGDETLSRLHAVIERYKGGWSIRDLGSSNGTFVNGERIWSERALRHADEILVGKTRMVFRSHAASLTRTQTAAPAPEMTPRERDVILALCRPLLSGDLFTEPASIRDIASELFVTDAAVKQHLVHLYAKFAIDDGERRRVRLANEAIRRGAVTISDIRNPR